MKWLPLLTKFPKWAIAGGIVLGASVVFLGWKMMRGKDDDPPPKQEEASSLSFDPADVVLCGNTLVELSSGKVIAREWLKGYGNVPPRIGKVFPEQRLLVVGGQRGAVGAFDFDGNPKSPLQVDGKALPASAINRDCDEIVFQRGGDLWTGKLDWLNSRVDSPRKVTEVGYFRDDVFTGNWFWNEGILWVPLMGRPLEVNLANGSIKEVQLDIGQISHGLNPLGTLALVAVGGRYCAVVDLLSGQSRQFPVGERVREILWLSDSRAVVSVGRGKLGIYDHKGGKLDPVGSDEVIRDLKTPSPDGSSFLVVAESGVKILDTVAKKDTDLKLRFDSLEWISNTELLASCNAVNSEERGIWLVKKSGEVKRLANQPADGGGNTVPILPNGCFISGGELWRYEAKNGAAQILTKGSSFHPYLNLLVR